MAYNSQPQNNHRVYAVALVFFCIKKSFLSYQFVELYNINLLVILCVYAFVLQRGTILFVVANMTQSDGRSQGSVFRFI